jgi:hypothetical protein
MHGAIRKEVMLRSFVALWMEAGASRHGRWSQPCRARGPAARKQEDMTAF